MEAKELMLDDWVYGLYPNGKRYPHPFRIAAIDIYPTNKSHRIVTVGGYGFKEEHLAPIPITRDILLANGFTCPSIFYYVSEDGRITIDPNIANYPRQWYAHIDNEDFQSIASCDLDYLHQLQHFLKICGIEKEWKL